LRVCAFCGDETMGNECLLVHSCPRFGLIGTSREPTREGKLSSDLRHSTKTREQYLLMILWVPRTPWLCVWVESEISDRGAA
jgi:hypothetical protein